MKTPPEWLNKITSIDDRRSLAVPGNAQETLKFCVESFLYCASEAIGDHGYFAVALSGGSTPKAIFQALALPENRSKADWSRFLVFWSDERSCPPTDPESNYHMAMEAGLRALPILAENLFRMVAENAIEEHARDYEKLILSKIPQKHFDLVMLGMGDDGHTASLFPGTQGLDVHDKLAIANYVPQKNTWRMTLTFPCINAARQITAYVLGSGKEDVLKEVLTGSYQPDRYPAQCVGTAQNKALWIADDRAALRVKEINRC